MGSSGGSRYTGTGARWWWILIMSVCCGCGGATTPRADGFSVISVENMDSLLRLRLGSPGRLSGNIGGGGGASVARARRAATPATLCARQQCRCTSVTNGKYINVSCLFNNHEIIELTPESVPYNLLDIRLENMKELIIKRKTFGNTTSLNNVMLFNIGRLHINTMAFRNITSASLTLQIEECATVVLDNQSFSLMRGSVSAQFDSCNHIVMGSSVFSWLLYLSMYHVPNLELVQDTFATESVKVPRHGPGATILFHNVILDVIPEGAFSSRVREIKFVDSKINKISGGAFNAMHIPRVVLSNTQLAVMETGAFSNRTLVEELELDNVTLSLIQPNVIAAVSKLSILNSRIEELRGGAFNVKVAKTFLTSNTFTKIKRKAFEIRDWDSVFIEGNVFQTLEPDAFSLPFEKKVENRTVRFTDNILEKIEVSSLAFIPLDHDIEIHLWGNTFHEQCSCRLKHWTTDLVASEPLAEGIYNTSSCLVTDWLADCLNLHAGAIPMVNYTHQICGNASDVKCMQPSHRSHPAPEDLSWSLLLDNEKRVLTIILITVLSCVFVILILVAAKWVQQKGLVGRIMSQFFRSSSIVATASISRVNIHEYAEIHNCTTQTQIVEESDEEEIVNIDDKATQTLPEELTQDLLQSLREKLDDPDNYREARDMIEHLYDLIKVEESCNNRASIVIEDTLYAELQPRTRVRTRHRRVQSVGTRSPSLDKLSPVHYYPRPAVSNDYAEPRDRQEASHVYCELPGAGGGVPDVLMSSNTRMLANRPLPEAPQ